MADSTDEDSLECLACRDPITSAVDQRVVPALEDGEAVYRHFCSETCLEEWTA
ncbi:hypothetical protein SAMN04487967_0985 [Natronorubrum sediminis]|uniref:TRASH domain-containing protein n=1 Tax=Natronorubrum sediminis TaxID=640943 RepID=A0A1H6FPJ2_9EURY|nr:hypothetical protein [Natronorubrum sediminis]SEH12831.1 hypothetical protein SAMN04487967_0985 [Natronorubrum sediminis]